MYDGKIHQPGQVRMPISKIKTFDSSLEKVLEAYIKNEKIEGLYINEELKDPAFRFKTRFEGKLSFNVSEALSYARHSKDSINNIISPEVSKLGREAKTKKADDYAVKIFYKIEEMKKTEVIKSSNATANKLNENKIPSPTGKQWQAKTVIDMEKRWEKLGLKPTPAPKLE